MRHPAGNRRPTTSKARVRFRAMWCFAVLAAAGCSKDASTGASSSASAKVVAAPPTSLACVTFSRAECMRATHCTLVLNKEGKPPASYLCRDAKGPCEENLAQWNRAECRQRDGCAVDNGGCYCHCAGYGRTAVEDKSDAPGCACACAGGPPVRCRSKDEITAAASAKLAASSSALPADSSAPAASAAP